MVYDYRGFDNISIRDDSPPPIEEALDRIVEVCDFSKFGQVGAYHRLRIEEEHTHKTAICTPFGTYEWRILSFAPAHAPFTFTRPGAEVFKDLNRDPLAFYLDDVIIYSRNEEKFENLYGSF